MQPQNFNLNKPAYSVNELLGMLPIGRTKLYEKIRNGELKATKLGKKTLFLAQSVADFLASLPPMQNGGTHVA